MTNPEIAPGDAQDEVDAAALLSGRLDMLPDDQVPEGWTPWYLAAVTRWRDDHWQLLADRQAENLRRKVSREYAQRVRALTDGVGQLSDAMRHAAENAETFAAAVTRHGLGTATQARLAHGLQRRPR